jgi:hypothetical protein
MKKAIPRPQRINRIAKKLTKRYEKLRFSDDRAAFKPLKRKETKHRLRPMIAYDLETTSFKAGTPEPLYITAYGENFRVSLSINGLDDLEQILTRDFLTDENVRARFVAWNGNNYDVYFIALALLKCKDYVIRPYLTRSKALRGIKVSVKNSKYEYWEFLDGIAMTGLVGTKLKFFLKTFAPEYQKLDAPDFERETFDIKNKKHIEYADRDSEGLYYGMKRAQDIVIDNIGIPLQPTIGNLGIKAFMRNMPLEIQVWTPPLRVLNLIRDYVMRGGYCHNMRRYHGAIWKYDLNQAYAAAMREADLPCGSCVHTGDVEDTERVGIYQINARNRKNIVPFYYRTPDKFGEFGTQAINDAWITSIELAQLRAENWDIEILDGYYWTDLFSMKSYVDKLEHIRVNAPDGVNGATGLMIKAIGNNSYGKTVEENFAIELLMALEQPDGFSEYQVETDEMQFIWFKFGVPAAHEYHQPQLGAFITAHVRMVVRRAALLKPEAFLYADTDCVCFSESVALDIDPKKYGKWKVEVENAPYMMIEKKVYASLDGKVKHAKGMNINRLTLDDFTAWHNGNPPTQKQLHRNNIVKVLTGAPMFHDHTKTGQRIAPVPVPVSVSGLDTGNRAA